MLMTPCFFHHKDDTTPHLRKYIARLLLMTLAMVSAPAMAGITIQHWQTRQGAAVYFVATRTIPMLDIRLVFDAGSARDQDHPGIARLTSSLIDDGADGLNADQIASQFEALGARFSAQSLTDMAVIKLRSLSDPKRLQPAFELLTRILKDPSFPQDALNRERQRQLIDLQAEQESPGDITQRLFMVGVFGKHPYASPPLGTQASLPAIKRDDIVSYYRTRYVAANAVIALVGDLSRAQAEQMAKTLSQAIPKGQAAAQLPAVAALTQARSLHQDFPSSQTHILIGQPGMRRDDPDYFPLYVGNFILGGSGLVSRISDEVREKRGLAYSAYSYFSPMHVKGPFTMGLQTRNEQAPQARQLITDILRQFIDKGPTGAELKAAKQSITGGFPLRLSSNRKIIGYLASIGFYHLPLDYLDRFNDRVNAITAQQIVAAFQRRIQVDHLLTVSVGKDLSGP